MQNFGSVPPADQTKLWNKSYIMVLLLGILTSSGSQMVTPLMTRYVKEMGASLTIAATIASLMSITALFFRPISGLLADHLNRKKILIISTGLTVICVAGYSIVHSLPLLFTLRILHGVAFGFSGVASMAFSTSFIPKDRIGEGMGYMSMGTIVSSAIGPNIGLFVADKYGYTMCFLISAVFTAASIIFMLFIPYKFTPPAEKASKKNLFKNMIAWEIIVYAMLMGLFSCGNGLITAFMAVLGDERAIPNVTLFFTVYSLVVFVVRPLTGKLLDRKGLAVILYPSFVIAAAGMVVLGAASALWMVILAGALKALGQGAGTPSIQADVIRRLGRERAGTASSTCLIFQDIGNAISPVIGGAVATAYGFGNMFYGYAAILAIVGPVIFYLKRRSERKKQQG